jgi:hypothetical protein
MMKKIILLVFFPILVQADEASVRAMIDSNLPAAEVNEHNCLLGFTIEPSLTSLGKENDQKKIVDVTMIVQFMLSGDRKRSRELETVQLQISNLEKFKKNWVKKRTAWLAEFGNRTCSEMQNQISTGERKPTPIPQTK